MLSFLDELQQKGYDISAIRTAIQNGDTETTKTLMEQFRTAHPDAFPTRGTDTQNNEDRQARMLSFLDELQQKGYDISAIRAAIQNGDTETAKTLMEQFRTAHPDAFPSHAFMGKGRSSPQGTGSA
jgi:DNA-binding transcriptional MerR regulator